MLCSSCYFCKTMTSSFTLVFLFRTFDTVKMRNEIESAGGDFMDHVAVLWNDFLDPEGKFEKTLNERDVRTVPVHGPRM